MWRRGDVAFFDRIARLYDLVHPEIDAERYLSAFDAAEGDVDRILDLAGGTGRVSASLPGVRPLVVDASRGMVGRVPSGVDAALGDATALPVCDERVDAVVCVDALHHLPDAAAAVDEVQRVLRPGGVFVVVEFDPETVRGRLVELGERAIGMGSQFRTAETAAGLLTDAEFDADVRERGFEYVVVGTKR